MYGSSYYTSVGELLVNANSATGDTPWKFETVKALLDKIPNSGSGANLKERVGNLKTQLTESDTATEPNAITSSDLRANNSDKSVVVRLGGLDWIVTFISNDKDNGNVIATLWLSNSHQEAWGWNGTGGTTASDTIGWNKTLGTYYEFINGGLYSKWSYNNSANAVYGTSYIRAATLNNPSARTCVGVYNSTSETYSTIDCGEQVKTLYNSTNNTGHPLALYTVSDFGLTNYLTTPSQMKWQIYLQDQTKAGYDTSSFINRKNSSLTANNAYGYSNSASATSENDATWGADYLWLPSVAEAGRGVRDDAKNWFGLWQTSVAERSNYDGESNRITTDTYFSAFLRSNAQNNTADDNYCDVSYFTGSYSAPYTVSSYTLAVRPAMHLNLTAIAETVKEADISFDQQGGTGGASAFTVLAGNTLSNVTVPTRVGYTFGGYFTQINGGGTKIYNASGTPVNSTSTFTANVTLYAQWTANTYTVKYNANGGSGTMSNSSHTYGTAKNLTTNTFTRTGYTFAGWTTSSGGAKVYNNSQSVTNLTTTNGATVNLYAVWTACTYNVVFDDSGFVNKVGAKVGGFENTGWSGGVFDTTHVRSGQYSFKVVGSASDGEMRFHCTTQNVTLNSTNKTHKYYAQYWGYQETANNQKTQMYWPVEEPYFGQADLGPAGQWNMYSFYGDRNSNALTGEMVVRLDFDNYHIASTMWFDDFLLIDLTELFGAGNEPSKAWCDAMIRTGVSTQQMSIDTATTLTHSETNTIPGMTFAGWSTSPRTGNATQTLTYPVGQSVTNIAAVNETKILYAVWQPNNYNITINTNNETAVGVLLGAGPQPYGATVTIAAYAKKGYNFSHWLRDGQEFDGNDQNTLKITINITNPTYTAVFEEAGINIDGMSVLATYGGAVHLVGADFENLSDTDTITVATDLCVPGYRFVGWYLDNDRTNCLSTDTSYAVKKSVAYKHILVAVYEPASNSNVNLETNN